MGPTEDERTLYLILVNDIIERLFPRFPKFDEFWDSGASDGEACCRVLWSLAAIDRPGGTVRLKESAFQVVSRLRQGFPQHAASTVEVLRAWLGLESFKPINTGLPSVRTPFEVSHDYTHIASELARLGYLEEVQDRFVWTEKARPAMQEAGLWDHKGRSFEELQRYRIRISQPRPSEPFLVQVVGFNEGQEAVGAEALRIEFGLHPRDASLFLQRGPIDVGEDMVEPEARDLAEGLEACGVMVRVLPDVR